MSWTHHINEREVIIPNSRSLKIKEGIEYFRKRIKFTGPLVLKDSDYAFMKGLELNNRYGKHTYKIKLNDVIKAWCEFTINDCVFDDAQKTCTLSLHPRDEYTLIQENWEKEVNILANPKKIYNIKRKTYLVFQIFLKTGDIPENWSLYWATSDYWDANTAFFRIIYQERIHVDENYNIDTSVWVEIENNGNGIIIYGRNPVNFPTPKMKGEYTGPDGKPSNADIEIYTSNHNHTIRLIGTTPIIYYREGEEDDYFEYITKIPYQAFSVMEDIWIPLVSSTFTVTDGINPDFETTFWVFIKADFFTKTYNDFGEQGYSCVYLEDAMNTLLRESVPEFTGKVVSTLLFNSLNCEGEPDLYTNNYGHDYVTKETRKFKYLISKDDFVRPNATSLALINKYTLKKITEFLKRFKIEWHIDSQGNLRYEHVSYYYLSETGTDLTGKEVTGKYSYYKDETPNRIILHDNEVWGDDFTQKQILYGDIPADEGEQESKDEYSFSGIYVDVDGMNEHLSNLATDGFVMIDIENGVIDTVQGISSGENIQNAGLSLANVIYNYWNHDCFKPTFTLEGYEYLEKTEREAKSLKKMKKHEIEFTHDRDIDILKLVETFLGTGEFVSLEYPPSEGGTIKAEIRYE